MTYEICRTCLREGVLTSIYNKLDTADTISTKIISLTKIQILPDDGLPSKICKICIKSLKDCLKFIKLCETSDCKLRSSQRDADTSIQESLNLCNSENCSDVFNEDYNHSTRLDDEDSYIEICLPNKEALEKNYLIIDESKSGNCLKRKKSHREQCFTCGKVMSSRFRLKTHLRTHTGEKPYSCPQCDKLFSLEQSLKVHIRIHTGEKPLACNVCSATFAQPAGLAAHRRKHTGQMPYHCTLCPRRFRTPGHFQYHVRCHTGEKNFECATCGRAFITKSDLKQHLAVHSGTKPHVCSICGLSLVRAAHLKRHMNVHHGSEKLLKKSASKKKKP